MRVEARRPSEKSSPELNAFREAQKAILDHQGEFNAASARELGATFVEARYLLLLSERADVGIPFLEGWMKTMEDVRDAMEEGNFRPLREFLLKEAWNFETEWVLYRGQPEKRWEVEGNDKLRSLAHKLPDRGAPFMVSRRRSSQISLNSL